MFLVFVATIILYFDIVWPIRSSSLRTMGKVAKGFTGKNKIDQELVKRTFYNANST